MSDIDLHVALMEAGRMNLIHLPPGAISWLWDRPTKQVDAAESLAVAANAHGNPVVDASLLKADQNILLIKCEGGECFRIYPDGGFSHEDTPMDIGGCSSVLQGQMQSECPMDDNGHQMSPEDGPRPIEGPGQIATYDQLMGAMDGGGMMEDGGDSGAEQTYWLYLGDRHVASVRLPPGASERDVKMKALHQQHMAPGVSHLYPDSSPGDIKNMIHHSEVRMFEDPGNAEHMDTMPPESGVASPQGMTNLEGEPTMDEDQGGDWGGPGASVAGGMGTGTPYVGDIAMDADPELENQMMSRELGEKQVFVIRDTDDETIDGLMKAMGLLEMDDWSADDYRRDREDDMRSDQDRAPTPPEQAFVEVYDAATNSMKELAINISWDVQPTEYEGPHVFAHGGATVDDMALAEPIQVNGKVYAKLDNELAALIMATHHQDEVAPSPQAWESLRQHIEDREGSDVDVPTQRYPSTR
jgi:hypothetical protein